MYPTDFFCFLFHHTCTGFPIIDFWPQYQNEYTNWVSWPTNIGNSAKEFEGLGKYFAIILDALGLPNLARGLELLIEFANTTTGAFRTKRS